MPFIKWLIFRDCTVSIFKSVVEAHIKLIDANHARFEILTSLLNKKDTSAVYAANAFYLYAHGLLWGWIFRLMVLMRQPAALGNEMGVTYEPCWVPSK